MPCKDTAKKSVDKARAAAKLPAETTAEIFQGFQAVLSNPAFVHVEDLPSSAAQVFGIQSGGYMSGAEPDSLASCRILTQGFRTVITTDASSLMEVMAAFNIPTSQMSPPECWKFFLNCSEQQIQALVEKQALHCVTQGAFEMLFMPPGMVWADRSVNESDVYGFLTRGLLRTVSGDSNCLTHLEAIRASMQNNAGSDAQKSGVSTAGIDKAIAFLKQLAGEKI